MKYDILLIEDDVQVAESLKNVLSSNFSVYVSSSAESALEVLKERDFSLILCDLKLPGMSGLDLLKNLRESGNTTPFIMITAFGDIPTAVQAMRLGANDFLRKGDITPDELIRKINELLFDEDFGNFVAESQVMKNLLAVARRVAKTDSTVLILGESGVGKEVFARYIHKVSPRANRPFIAVNMAAIPDSLLEAELFGYEKGAFTGAERRKPGKFELASGGTILLDEIGDMPLHLQSKVLRVIQEKKVERLGQATKEPVKVDVRIISTTNKNLENLVREGKFREDLFYRISVVPIRIPPLRERKEDILPLTYYFISKLKRKYNVDISITQDAIEKLMEYDWPGNVRELQNVIERAFIISWSGISGKAVIDKDSIIFSADEISRVVQFSSDDGKDKGENLKKFEISENLGKEGERQAGNYSDILFDDLNIKNMEKIFILKALERTGGNKTKAAQLLGITPRTLRNKLKELKIENQDETDDNGQDDK